MRLVNLTVTGFRRFENESINLDGHLVAIVGPNEAGKSSLLNALLTLENNKPFGRQELTRGMSFTDDSTIVEALYLIEQEDKDAVKEIMGAIGSPRWYTEWKVADGNRYHKVEPELKRDTEPRKKTIVLLDKLLSNSRINRHLEQVYLDSEEAISLVDEIKTIKIELAKTTENIASNFLKRIKAIIQSLTTQKEKIPQSYKRSIELSEKQLIDLYNLEVLDHPNDVFLEKISKRLPKVLLFSEAERSLSSDYPISVLDAPPPALKNLFSLAKLNINELQNALIDKDHGKREFLNEEANKHLKTQFEEAWKQSEVFVRLQIDADIIRVLIPASDAYSDIAERSDGLRAFIALYAFTALQEGLTKPILLIDEAESHLHYDAQTDLVQVMENQDTSSQIIYTTHSAGCLPDDLGTGVRAIIDIHISWLISSPAC